MFGKVGEYQDAALKRQLQRWYPLIEHPVQLALVRDNTRFKLCPAGRRSGKTERAKRFVVKKAMKVVGQYFVAAPTRDQVQRIYWNDLKDLSLSSIHPVKPRESNLIIALPNGSTISLIGLDAPERMEGISWSGGIIDEIADVHPDAWGANISPALDTIIPGRTERAWCWLIGVPEGLNHYYDMCEYAKHSNDPDWKLYTWHSSEILPPDVIASAKARLSPRQFRQEYEASFETASGRVYEDYSVLNNTNETLQPHEQILWMHDFNFSPMSSAIGTRKGNNLYLLDEIILHSATARQSALEFVEKFKNHQNRHVIIYGDPAGRAGEKHGHNSDYTEMEQVLRANGWNLTRKVKAAAPAIKDRQNAVRAKILSADGNISLFVSQKNAVYCHRGLSNTTLKEGSTFLEEEGEYQHITTAIGYCVDYEWPISLKKQTIVKAVPTVHYY